MAAALAAKVLVDFAGILCGSERLREQFLVENLTSRYDVPRPYLEEARLLK